MRWILQEQANVLRVFPPMIVRYDAKLLLVEYRGPCDWFRVQIPVQPDDAQIPDLTRTTTPNYSRYVGMRSRRRNHQDTSLGAVPILSESPMMSIRHP